MGKYESIEYQRLNNNEYYLYERRSKRDFMIMMIKKYWFLFEELVKRDFKQKYKRTVLGMGWSILSPLLQLLVMTVVFSNFFADNMEHYTIYLFCGNLLFGYFTESTTGGMSSLLGNAHIFSKVNVPKSLFLISKNVSVLINFLINLCIFFVFCILDRITFGVYFVMLIYPILCLIIFNIGIGLILSALFVFFRDLLYLYNIFIMLLMYLSAIFYTVDIFEPAIQNIFYFNPLYCYITYFRMIVLNGVIPPMWLHGLCLFYAILAVIIGAAIYKKNKHKFLYYV